MVEIGNEVLECPSCWPTWWRCSGCQKVEAASPSPSSTGQELEEKRTKRKRQKEESTSERLAELARNKMAREYSFYLRAAYVSTVKCPVEYYSAPDDMWTPPEPGFPYNADDVTRLVVKGSGLEFPYPDVAVPGRDVVPPATQASVEQRQAIAAVQEAQTMESLERVGVALPNPPEIDSGSQSAEAAQAEPEPPTDAGATAQGSTQWPLLVAAAGADGRSTERACRLRCGGRTVVVDDGPHDGHFPVAALLCRIRLRPRTGIQA